MKKAKGASVYFPPPLIFLVSIGFGYYIEKYIYSVSDILKGKMLGLGWALIVLAIVLLKLAVQRFKETHQDPTPWVESPALIVEGIYCYTRNPMYLGMALIQLGVGINLSNIWVIALTPLSLFLVFFIAVRPEEKYLVQKFGQPYIDYKGRVGRWI